MSDEDKRLLAALEEGSMRLELMQALLADIQQGNCELRKRVDALSLSVSRLSQARQNATTDQAERLPDA